MKIRHLALLFIVALLPCQGIAEPVRLQLQSCISLEYANVLASAPKGMSAQDAFKHGYSKGFDFVTPYEKALLNLPNPEIEVPKILRNGAEAGERMSKNLTKAQIVSALQKCQEIFIPAAVSDIAGANLLDDNALLSRVKPIANTVNNVWLDAGLLGLIEHTDMCYAVVSGRPYDCLITDIASIFINSIGPNPNFFDFFSAKAFNIRLSKIVNSGQLNSATLAKAKKILEETMPKILTDDVSDRESRVATKCKIFDPDISTSYAGECPGGFADGYGVAQGRDEYKGYFKNGLAHGYGVYVWGAQSEWATEEYRGWYFNGLKSGFGTVSISGNSYHPALESFKKTTQLKDGRYYASGLFKAGKMMKRCISEEECMKEIQRFSFPDLKKFTLYTSSIKFFEIQRLTKKAIYDQSDLSKKINECISRELLSEFFGKKSGVENVTSNQVLSYVHFLQEKQMAKLAVLHCSQ